MGERPILFSAPMIRALLDGTKTQTRRVVKGAPVGMVRLIGRDDRPTGEYGFCATHDRVINRHIACPYGVPGDVLWVREGFLREADPFPAGRGIAIWYRADGEPTDGEWTRPKPSIHMPRWASRIILRVTDVRVERLNEISEGDALAEGVQLPGEYLDMPRAAYRALWETINGPGSWAANPFVWAVSFERIA